MSRIVRMWSEFTRSQRARLEQSNHPHDADTAPGADSTPGPAEPDLVEDLLREAGADHASGSTEAEPTEPSSTRFGAAGRPLNRQSPFYIGFVGASGAIVAVGLWHGLGRLATTLTILLVALFLTLSLNPIVEALVRRGYRRASSVTLVFLGLLVTFVLLGLVVIPPVVAQATDLTQKAPDYVSHLAEAEWVQRMDRDYGVLDKIQNEFTKKVQDPNFLSGVFGGVLGAGKIVASGIFQTLTILILTLYFLASLPRVKHAAYAIVPASRRTRFEFLSEEIMRRVGSYAIGQVGVATFNALCSWVMMTIVGIPYAAVLAVAVGFLGLIPMVGATLGAAVVCIVAFFDEPKKAIIALVYYVVYQQIENYVIVPRIMQRTVSVPGAVTVVAALAGGTLLGVLGALLAIPVAAGLLLLFEEVLVPRQSRH